jgi:hypothetical protein
MTATQSRPGTRRLIRPALAAGASATALVLAGLYVDTPWKADGSKKWAFTSGQHGLGGLLVSVAFVAAGLAVVFGVLVFRGRNTKPAVEARLALALACTGVLSLAVFWTGMPVILASGATVLALHSRAVTGRTPATAAATVALAAIAAVIALTLALVG